MLTQLAIRDLVIVPALELEFGAGMSALTGETGAGKSILIDALGLTLGDKASPGMIRQGRERAEVSSGFDLDDCPQAAAWLEEHDFSDEGQCLLRRVLVREGRSRAYINGSPAPLSALRELGALLLDIHGQHAHHSLLKSNSQRRLLDTYGGLEDRLAKVTSDYQALTEARESMQTLRAAAEDRASRMDYLAFQLAELEPLLEAAQDLASIEQEHARLSHADRLQAETSEIVTRLTEGEHDLEGQVARIARQLGELARLDDQLQEMADMLDSAAIQLDEAGQSLRSYRDGLELDPYRLQQVDEELARLHDQARKHRTEISELPALFQRFQQELDTLSQAEQNLNVLEQEIAACEKAYAASAGELSRARIQAAEKLSRVVSESMQQLNMKGGRFEVRVAPDPDQTTRQGIDRIEFRVAPNPGQAMASLAETASGGELSRISLAIQVATADCGEIPTLIFDEVDVGIGGAVAEIVGGLLRRLGNKRQVLCVTHLPQVAAQAHAHFQVQKKTQRQSTATSILPLDQEQRVNEIARMLGGVKITSQTLAHAREMLQQA